MDSADAQSVVVEAESWQKALHAARTARGETGPISGFSIELLDEGYRAVDPLARRRYDVKRAAEGTPVTGFRARRRYPPPPSHPLLRHLPTPGRRRKPCLQPRRSRSARPAPTSRKPPPAPPASKPAPVIPSAGVEAPPVEREGPRGRPRRSRPEQVIVPTAIMSVAPANGGADATIRTEAVHVAPSSPLDRTVRGADAPPAELDFGPIPPTQVIFKREHDPNERLPLTYREYVFTVARGVNEESGERLLRAQFHQVRASIANARPGKFVNLAVFDVVFQGKPPVPPLATLAWKDWRGEPVIAFPRRPSTNHAAPTPPPPPSFPAPAPTPIGPPVSAVAAGPRSAHPRVPAGRAAVVSSPGARRGKSVRRVLSGPSGRSVRPWRRSAPARRAGTAPAGRAGSGPARRARARLWRPCPACARACCGGSVRTTARQRRSHRRRRPVARPPHGGSRSNPAGPPASSRGLRTSSASSPAGPRSSPPPPERLRHPKPGPAPHPHRFAPVVPADTGRAARHGRRAHREPLRSDARASLHARRHRGG